MPTWKQKALLQRVLSIAPSGHRINLLFQRHITHGLPIPRDELRAASTEGVRHVGTVREANNGALPAGVFYEFGAGFDLHMPLILWSLGVDRQIVVDIRPLLVPDLLFEVAKRLADEEARPEFTRRLPSPTEGQPAEVYLRSLGIEYRAPADAKATDLPSGSTAVITSTNTLEHIPPEDIAAILEECHRILADDGLMSFQIDYQDHYSYFDGSLSPYNFLQYDDRTWRRYNSPLHFQNRLRHGEHRRLIERAGFVVVTEELVGGSDDDLRLLGVLDLDPQWSRTDAKQLAIRSSHLVLRKAGSKDET